MANATNGSVDSDEENLDVSNKSKTVKNNDSDVESDKDDSEYNNDEKSSEEGDIDMSEDDIDEDTDYDKLRATIRDAVGNDGALTDTVSISNLLICMKS